jgi:hypothetical protein
MEWRNGNKEAVLTPRGGDDGGEGGMWEQTVETRLAELRADIQSLRSDMHGEFRSFRDRQERDFRLMFGTLIAVSIGLAGLMARGFGWIG